MRPDSRKLIRAKINPRENKSSRKFIQLRYVLIGGDFNARVGNMQDYIEENEEDLNFLNLPQNYQFDKYKIPRSNQDQHKNEYGLKLIELALSSNMKILNGRIIGDIMGNTHL